MTESISITGLSHGPAAVGRSKSGKVVFVPYAAPGDTVEVAITKETKSFCEATLVSVQSESAQRIQPACPFFGQCGGCSWMHIAYEAQLEAKRADVVNQLSRIGGVKREEAEALVAPCRASKKTLSYRNKLELASGFNDAGAFQVGFHQSASSEIVTPQSCPLAASGIEKAPRALRGALSYLQGKSDLGIYRIGVRRSLRTKQTEIALWTPPQAFPRKMAVDTLSSALRNTSIVRVLADPGKARKVKKVEALSGNGYWEEELSGFRYMVSAPSFFQVNTPQAEAMIAEVVDSLELTRHSVVADLYCGVGSFTLPLAQRCDTVFAVESAASAVRDLRRNAQINNADIDVIGGDSARELAALGALDALIVDPPRAGLAESAPQTIAQAGPERLAYVSCNPATWARDIARLARVGYTLKKAIPFDLFPQTYHVETLSILEKTQ